jgi:hypothetical protein
MKVECISGVVVGIIIAGIVMHASNWLTTGDFRPAIGVRGAILKCEARLPRDLHCEPVYGAKVALTQEEEG